jgi:hypothetical protein
MVLRSVLCLLPAPASPNLTFAELNLYGFSEYVPVDLMATFKQATGWCAGPRRRYGG